MSYQHHTPTTACIVGGLDEFLDVFIVALLEMTICVYKRGRVCARYVSRGIYLKHNVSSSSRLLSLSYQSSTVHTPHHSVVHGRLSSVVHTFVVVLNTCKGTILHVQLECSQAAQILYNVNSVLFCKIQVTGTRAANSFTNYTVNCATRHEGRC